MHDPATPAPPAAPPTQPRNPLHGLTLEHIVTALADHYGWDGLNERIPARCFASNPSVKSSLKFLRRTWGARRWKGCTSTCSRSFAGPAGGDQRRGVVITTPDGARHHAPERQSRFPPSTAR